MQRWIDGDGPDYDEGHDDLAGDRTSRLSPYLHFGCVSPVELVHRADAVPAFVRQVAWRDFHHQVLAARPTATRNDFRPRGDRWRRSRKDLEAWKNGRTGLPLVDAGMRQLLSEGWMHNRPVWSPATSSPRPCTSTGAWAHSISSTTWSTGTLPTTR